MKWSVQSAVIEFQPDLQNPRSPVALGVVALAHRADEGYLVLLGRAPKNRGLLPDEFGTLSPLGVEVAMGWIDAFFRDSLESRYAGTDLLEHLVARWKWNLYVTELHETTIPTRALLLSKALSLYEKATGETFPLAVWPTTSRKRKRRGHQKPGWTYGQTQLAA